MNDRELEARIRADLRVAGEQPVPERLARSMATVTVVERSEARWWWPRAAGGFVAAVAAVVIVAFVASSLGQSSAPAVSSVAPSVSKSGEPLSSASTTQPRPSASPSTSGDIQTGPFNWQPLNTTQLNSVAFDALLPRPDGTLLALGRAQLVVSDAGAGWSTTVWQSTDGSTWTRVPGATQFTAASQSAAGYPAWNAVALSAVRTASGYVAVGMDQFGDASSANASAWYSADGVHWTRATVADGQGRTMEDVVSTSGGLVALGAASYSYHPGMGGGTAIWTSADGRTWSQVPAAEAPPLGTRLFGIVSAPGGYLAAAEQEYPVGDTSVTVTPLTDGIWRSSDAIHWAPVAGSPLGVTSIAVRGDTVVAVGSGGHDLSQPAIAWTWSGGSAWSGGPLPSPSGLPSGVGVGVRYVVTEPEGLLAIGERTDGDTAPSIVVWSSSDGTAWTVDAVPTPIATAIAGVFPLASGLLVVGVAQPDTGPVPVMWRIDSMMHTHQAHPPSPGSTDPAIAGASDVPCPGGNPCGPGAGTATPTPSVAATPNPSVAMADCGPGDVAAALHGYGGAGGTMYVTVEITPTHASCSVPAAALATAVDAAGARVTVGGAPDIPAGSRIAVTSIGILFRIAVNSWCQAARLAAFDLTLDPATGLEVSVALPADVTAPCSGSATSLSLSEPIQP